MEYIILGGSQAALPIIRSLSREGKKVHVLCHKHEVANYSRHGIKYLLNKCESPMQALNCIVDSDLNTPFMCLLASEEYVKFSKEIEQVERVQGFFMGAESMAIFSNKFEVYKLARKHGIKVLDYSELLPSEEVVLNEYPLIIKWALFNDDSELPKTAIVKNKLELEQYFSSTPKSVRNKIIVQKMVEGYKSYSYGSIWRSGKLVDSVVVQQLRQYPLGVTSAVQSINGQLEIRVESMVKALAKTVYFNGFIEVEFIEKSGELFLIDVNPRIWGWSAGLFKKHYLSWSELLTDESYVFEKGKAMCWVNLLRDIPAILKGGQQNKNNLSIYKQSNTIFQFIDFLDPLPEIYGIMK